MDLDAFTAARTERWHRLDELGRARRLTGAEADELVRLYQATATDLSQVRAAAPDPNTVTHLSQLLARSRVAISGAHEPSWRDVVRFLAVTLPAAFYRIRWWTVGVMVGFLVIGTLAGWYVWAHEDVLNNFMDPVDQKEYVNNAFASYYDPGVGFAAMVWTNNAWIAAQCIGLGISGVWPVFVQVNNAVSVGAIGGMMAHHDALDVFLSLIAPHGMLELTAIWVAGAAGLRIFWTWLVPGPRPRSRALAEEGRALFTVAIGLVIVLGVSGLVEGFVTGSGLPSWLKITIGAIVLAGYWVYTIVLGRRAVEVGETGDLEADQAGATVPLAA
ncbi:MAG: stage II sporulation protein M [Actinomycetales bacterium]|nr:stage II sporulation protein M [Actinomycetales bacterium]